MVEFMCYWSEGGNSALTESHLSLLSCAPNCCSQEANRTHNLYSMWGYCLLIHLIIKLACLVFMVVCLGEKTQLLGFLSYENKAMLLQQFHLPYVVSASLLFRYTAISQKVKHPSKIYFYDYEYFTLVRFQTSLQVN